MTDTSNCTSVSPSCPVSATTYGYTPNLGGNIFFATIFGLCAFYHLITGLRSKAWTFMIALTLGSAMELAGYIGRILMHYNPWNNSGFELQIICLILAPSFVAASIYWSLKHIVLCLGPEYSRIRPNLYPWIFIGCDIGSILLQAAGGGVAAAAKKTNQSMLSAGNNIMMAGIAFQVATMVVCGILGVDFAYRAFRKTTGIALDEKFAGTNPSGFLFFCAGEAFAYLTVLIRCIYRMVALAVLTLTILHPYYMCPSIIKSNQ